MDTMNALPDLEGRKFGTLSLGYDRIGKIRDEFSVLLALAATVAGVPPEQVTVPMVERLTADLRRGVLPLAIAALAVTPE